MHYILCFFKAEKEESKGLKIEDPFTRRSTRPTMMSKDPKLALSEAAAAELASKLEAEKISQAEKEKKLKVN